MGGGGMGFYSLPLPPIYGGGWDGVLLSYSGPGTLPVGRPPYMGGRAPWTYPSKMG
jgi:hypothetical protein